MTNSHTEDSTLLPAGWKWTRLEDVIAEIQPGFACGQRQEDGIVQVRMNNVTTVGAFDFSALTRVPTDFADIEKYALVAGDILFNNTNSPELVGKSAIFHEFDEPVVFSNHFSRLRPVTDFLESGYLAKWLIHNWQMGVFAALCNRWVNQAAVPRDKLLALAIPLPPLSEQKRITATLNEQMAAVERARKAAQAQLAEIEALPSVLLRAAFSGEL